METNGLSLKSQEIGSKRKWETTGDLSRRFSSNQHESPWEGVTAKHITCHSSGYQGHSSQEWPPWNDGPFTTTLGRQKDFLFCSNQHESPWEGGTTEHITCHSSGYQGHSCEEWPPWNDGSLTTSLGRQKDFRFCSNQHESPWEGGKTEHQDKMNGIITCLVCGKEGHYSCDCTFKDQEHKVICTLCSKNGHCSMWCCQQNKSENRACALCGEIGHSASTHGLNCSSCDEYHLDGECRLSEVKCFICECQDHYLAQCPLNSVLNAAFQDQRENFQAALRLALSKQGNTLSRPAKCSAKSKGKVQTANKSSPIVRAYNLRTRICFTCREEGHDAFYCPQKSRSISPDLPKEFEESSTIATCSNLSKELEERDPGTGTAKLSSEMKLALGVRCVRCDQEGHRAKSCPTRVFVCYKCNEEGHKARKCPQKRQKR